MTDELRWLIDGDTARTREDRRYSISRSPAPGHERADQKITYALWALLPAPAIGGTFVASKTADQGDTASQLEAIRTLKWLAAERDAGR